MKTLYPSSRRIEHKSARHRLRIGRSRIHGFGVFALDEISAGRQLIEYTGRRLNLSQVAKLKPPHGDYLVVADHDTLINGSVGGSGAEFNWAIKVRRVPCVCGERECRKTLRYLIE